MCAVYVQRFSHELKEVEDNLRKDLSGRYTFLNYQIGLIKNEMI
jgi:hypothetical protein